MAIKVGDKLPDGTLTEIDRDRAARLQRRPQ